MAKNTSPGTENTTAGPDLPDTAKDRAKMKPDEATLELPDVEDIPGQENIAPPSLNELADLTASSADEEGDDLFGDENDTEAGGDPDSEVSAAEAADLEGSANDMPTEDDINLRRAALDNTDAEGVLLNEGSFNRNITGSDLDVPGSADDDGDEEVGEEDEENNSYSLGGDNHDDNPEDNF
jgi:hypothetical protein